MTTGRLRRGLGLFSLATIAVLTAFNLAPINAYAQSTRDYDRDRDYSNSPSKRITITDREIIISTDTVLRLKMQDRLSSETSRVGDRFTAVMGEDLDVDGIRV